MAKLGQDQPDSSDLAQVGREWEGWKDQEHPGLIQPTWEIPESGQGRSPPIPHLQSSVHAHRNFLVSNLPALTPQPTLEGLGESRATKRGLV